MSVRSKVSKKVFGLMMAAAMVFAMAVPAQAAHITDVTLEPESDSVPAGVCNAFTVTLTGNPQTAAAGQTVDVTVVDQDDNNPNTIGNEAESDIAFCTPSDTPTSANYNQGGPNPQTVDEDANQTLNNDGACEATDDDGCDGTISGEVGVTDQNGEVTFGIVSNEEGTYEVTAFYDDNGNDIIDGAEQSDTSQKTFTQRVFQPQCSDGADNDGDGKIDFGTGPNNDPGCTSATDNDETDPNPSPDANQCEDGFDNDRDGKIDFGSDGGCQSRTDNDETGSGNRRLATAVTIRYNKPVKAFKGTVTNPAKRCRVNRRVALVRDRKTKPDFVVKRGRTNDKGNYLIKKRRVAGKAWYVRALKKQFPRPNGGTVFCLKGRSVTIRIARR